MPEPIVADNEAGKTGILRHQSGQNLNGNQRTEGQINILNSTANTSVTSRKVVVAPSESLSRRLDGNNKKIEQLTVDREDDWQTDGWEKCLF